MKIKKLILTFAQIFPEVSLHHLRIQYLEENLEMHIFCGYLSMIWLNFTKCMTSKQRPGGTNKVKQTPTLCTPNDAGTVDQDLKL